MLKELPADCLLFRMGLFRFCPADFNGTMFR